MKGFVFRHKLLVGIWVVVFGIVGYVGYIVASVSNGGDGENPYVLSNNTNQPSQQQVQGSNQTKQASMNKAIEDNGLEFTVTGLNCGDTTIGSNDYAKAEAQGQFCRLNVKIRNTSGQTASMPKVARVATADGKEYKMDVTATEYAQTDQAQGYWFEDITAGSSATGDIVFDLPASAKPTKAFLHGKEGTAGIEISLR